MPRICHGSVNRLVTYHKLVLVCHRRTSGASAKKCTLLRITPRPDSCVQLHAKIAARESHCTRSMELSALFCKAIRYILDRHQKFSARSFNDLLRNTLHEQRVTRARDGATQFAMGHLGDAHVGDEATVLSDQEVRKCLEQRMNSILNGGVASYANVPIAEFIRDIIRRLSATMVKGSGNHVASESGRFIRALRHHPHGKVRPS